VSFGLARVLGLGGVVWALAGLAAWAAGTTVAAATPRPAHHGGTLRLALAEDPHTLDPTLVYSAADYMLLPLLYQPLVDIVEGNRVVDNLTTRWSFSADKRTLTFELRPGVRFSNGREAVAADYAAALERAVVVPSAWQQYAGEIQGAAEFASGAAKSLAGVSAPEPHKLVVALSRTDASFPYWMALNFGMALARETVPDWSKDVGGRPVGTGPYLVEEWVRGARLRLGRNPYCEQPAPPAFDKIEILLGVDESTQTMMFERGELDVASLAGGGVSAADFPRMRREPRWGEGWQEAPLFSVINLNFNVEMPPLDDLRVRRAIISAIDRRHFERLTGERMTPGHGLITPAMTGYDPTLPCPPSDPVRARALLREAGYPDGLPQPLKLWHLNTGAAPRWAQAVQSDLAAAGVRVELRGVTAAVFGDVTTRRRGAELALFANNANVPDPCTFLDPFHSRFIADEDAQNPCFYRSAAVDDLLGQASGCADEARRVALYQAAQRRILADAPTLILGHQKLFALRQPWLRGPLVEPIWWFRFDRVWKEGR